MLPFKYSGSNAELAALADGLTEDIVSGLSRFSYLKVIARSSTSRYAQGAVDVRSAGKELGARYVLEGALRQAGAKLRVAVQQVDPATGAQIWAENYERNFSPEAVFELQDELVPRIVSTVADMSGILPRSMSEALRSRSPEELSPYEALMRSFGYGQRATAEELAAALSGLESAVRKAPGLWRRVGHVGAALRSGLRARIQPPRRFPDARVRRRAAGRGSGANQLHRLLQSGSGALLPKGICNLPECSRAVRRSQPHGQQRHRFSG